jgi:hypothetical protein
MFYLLKNEKKAKVKIGLLISSLFIKIPSMILIRLNTIFDFKFSNNNFFVLIISSANTSGSTLVFTLKIEI